MFYPNKIGLSIMTIEQQEKLSSFMDGEIETLSDISLDEENQQCWYRYHMIRNVMKKELHPTTLNLNIVNAVAKAIAEENVLLSQPSKDEIAKVPTLQLMWVKSQDVFAKFAQVGLAACVTLAIIAGVQYYQNSDDSEKYPVLNTVPIGVNVSPVGGISPTESAHDEESKLMDQNQYNKVKLLIQDYELQKRLNAH